MIYAQFKVLSTGYIDGSIPPQFSDDHKKPIDLLGSDGVAVLDGRKTITNLIFDAIKIMNNHINKNSIIGFEIIKANDFRGNGKILTFWYASDKYKYINSNVYV